MPDCPRPLVDAAVLCVALKGRVRLQADNINCHQFDGVHSVARSSLLGGRYRWAEVRTMCERFCRAASRYLTDGARPQRPLPTLRVASL